MTEMEAWTLQRLDELAPGFTVLGEIEIPRVGWEMDNTGWIIATPDGKRHFATTTHGSVYLCKDASELTQLAAECRKWANDADTALAMLKEQDA